MTYDIETLEVAKVKCLKSLLFHTRFFFKEQYNRKFIIGEHHEIICEALERVLRGDLKRLIINVAPRYGKTELAVKSLISHGLSLNPSAKFIHLSYADNLALDNSEAVKDLIQSELYQKVFPEVQIKKDSRAKDKWYTTQNGGVLARSASGQVTGFGAGQVDEELDDFLNDISQNGLDDLDRKLNFGGAIIIDDPVKPDDADSDTLREKVNNRYDSTIKNRVNSRNTPIIVIMQRLHPMDLSGYLQRDDEEDEWEVIELPCIKADGTPLWEFKHTIEELLRLKKANEIVFERQYMQNPMPKHGLMFPLKDLNYFDINNTAGLNDPDFTFVPCDPANEGGDDFAGGVFKLIGDKIFLTDVLYNTDGADSNELALVEMIKQSKANSVGVESVFGWVETARRVREDLESKGFEGEFRMLRPRTSKHSRILNRSSFIRNNMYFRSDYENYPQYYKFMRNLTSYLKIQEAGKRNKHDDAPDLCEMAGSYFEVNFAHLFGMNKI